MCSKSIIDFMGSYEQFTEFEKCRLKNMFKKTECHLDRFFCKVEITQ